MLKKILTLLGLTAAVVIMSGASADLTMQPIRSGGQWLMDLTSIADSDSVRVPLNYFAGYQEGYYNLFYVVDSVRDPIKLLIYYEESIDSAYGYENRVLYDSIVTTESTLVVDFESYVHGTDYGRFVIKGFASTADTCKVRIKLQPIPKTR